MMTSFDFSRLIGEVFQLLLNCAQSRYFGIFCGKKKENEDFPNQLSIGDFLGVRFDLFQKRCKESFKSKPAVCWAFLSRYWKMENNIENGKSRKEFY